jgi:hypothetical protein
MYCCLPIRRMIHIVDHRVDSEVVLEGDVLSHGERCFIILYSQYETVFTGFAARRAVR